MSMISLATSFPSTDLLRSGRDLTDLHSGRSTHYVVKMLELSEITSHIMLSQTAASGSFPGSLGLPPLYESADLSATVQVDECLNKFQKSLAPSFSFDFVQDNAENSLNRQQILLRLR